MADDTDALFGLILFILFLALLGYAAGGISSSPSTAGTTSSTHQSLPPLSGSEVSSCTGTLKQDDTAGTLNLKVYVDSTDAGQKCATASTTSGGTLKVTLAYTADETQMVSSSASCQSTTQPCSASVQVNGTDDLCVSAVAEWTPETSQSGPTTRVSIPKVVEPCMMTVPAGRTDTPLSDLPVHADDLEDEEGY